jgi:hypothetical protein
VPEEDLAGHFAKYWKIKIFSQTVGTIVLALCTKLRKGLPM